MSKDILVADIGGTNARFGMASARPGGGWDIRNFEKFSGDDYPTFEGALSDYLKKHEDADLKQAIFSVAGPVADNKVALTNRDWALDGEKLEAGFGFTKAVIVNDFAAMTRCIPELPEGDLLPLKKGNAHSDAAILVAGPGTGFGVGYLVPVTDGWQVMTTEGGHQAYSPQSDRELELLKILRADFGFVTLERVASGSGLPDVHEAVTRRHGVSYSPLSPAIIREKAKQGDPICLEICEIRAAAVMGAVADMALSGGARGGVVLAGGVSERMIEFFKGEEAMARFLERGKRSDYMEDIPIWVLTNPMAALIGAAALFADQEKRAS